jgi:hypothetical protein
MQLDTRSYTPMTIGNWLLTFIILAIPLVGFVMQIVWAVSAETHPSKRTFCQAGLILFGIMIALVIVIGVVGGGLAAVFAPKGTPAPSLP